MQPARGTFAGLPAHLTQNAPGDPGAADKWDISIANSPEQDLAELPVFGEWFLTQEDYIRANTKPFLMRPNNLSGSRAGMRGGSSLRSEPI